MRNILLVMVLVLGASTINAQGYLGCSKKELQESAAKHSWTLEYGNPMEDGSYWIQAKTLDDVQWTFFLNTSGLASMTIVDLMTNEMLGIYLTALSEDMAQMNPLEWRSYNDWGVVYVKLTPETEERYPYLTFTYELY